MKELIAAKILSLIEEIAALPENIILLAVLIVMGVMVLDSLTSHLKKKKNAVGLSETSQVVSVDGTSSLPIRTYVSDIQGLSGRPDALIKEDGFIIPIERKPLARKVRDRYVAQLLVYMRLVEEFEGKKPPHGYLILGPNCRRVKIQNTESRQAWLQSLIDEMRGILSGKEVKATPHLKKCVKCDVQKFCNSKVEAQPFVAINSKKTSVKRIVN